MIVNSGYVTYFYEESFLRNLTTFNVCIMQKMIYVRPKTE
jgi:hypothetical protein